ncbi:hypothetical protein FACS1894211_15680 [Clostridia bacterium]|nr:hypothetical protein FACS1894211_15680 [Clostridia bacterium]
MFAREVFILERAKSYLTKLAQGADPIGGQEIPNDSVLNNERVKKCLEYVCGVLQKVIDNGGKVVSVREKFPFYLTDEKRRTVILSEDPIAIGEFVEKVNLSVDAYTTKKLTGLSVTKWLVDHDYLAEIKIPVHGYKKTPILTLDAHAIGLEMREHTVGSTGKRRDEFVLTAAGQRFILDHINEIVPKKTGALPFKRKKQT